MSVGKFMLLSATTGCVWMKYVMSRSLSWHSAVYCFKANGFVVGILTKLMDIHLWTFCGYPKVYVGFSWVCFLSMSGRFHTPA